MTTNYDYITPKSIHYLMLDYGILGERGRAKGKPSVRKLAKLAGCNYTSLNSAMNGKRAFSEEIKSKLHHFFYVLSVEKLNRER